jgi:hypothetical protein
MPPVKYKLFTLLFSFTMLVSACGTTNSADTVATSVALTVQAQNAQQTANSPISVVTGTPIPTQLSGPTSTPLPRPTFAPPTGKDADCAKASLVEDKTIPDGTILKPGEPFTKIWRIQNTSTCVWDTNYKIVFWDGDVMGGAYVYNFPQQALPGDTVDIPLQLIAPAVDGEYKSYWKLQTPGGTSFGVGYDTPFWLDIVVSSSTKTDYGITSVTYTIERNPATGCPANVRWTIYATISVNGPVKVIYNWRYSDGGEENKVTLKFASAGSQTVSTLYTLHFGSNTGERWAQLFTTAPVPQDFGKATFLYDCK